MRSPLGPLIFLGSVAACDRAVELLPARVDPGRADAGPSFTVLAVELHTVPALAAPIAGATVEIDGPAGLHREASAGRDGRATFAGMDLARGPFTVSVVDREHRVTMWIDVTQEAAAENRVQYNYIRRDLPRDFTIAAEALDAAADTVTLRGALGHSRTGTVMLSPIGRGRSYQGGGPEYLVRVAPGAPTKLVAMEWTTPTSPTVSLRGIEQSVAQWSAIDVDALAADASMAIDLDAAPAVAPVSARIRLELPGGDDGPLGTDSQGAWVVASAESDLRALLGTTVFGDLTDDGRAFDLRGELVVVPGATLVTRVSIARGEGLGSTRLLLGPPSDGATISGLLLPPARPESPRLDAPIAIDGVAPRAIARFSLEDGIGSVRLVAYAPRGATTVRLPKLSAAASNIVQNANVGQLAALADFEPRLLVYTSGAACRRFSIDR